MFLQEVLQTKLARRSLDLPAVSPSKENIKILQNIHETGQDSRKPVQKPPKLFMFKDNLRNNQTMHNFVNIKIFKVNKTLMKKTC
jgi:hypothetical protein